MRACGLLGGRDNIFPFLEKKSHAGRHGQKKYEQILLEVLGEKFVVKRKLNLKERSQFK